MAVNTGNVFSALYLSEYMTQSLPKNTFPQLRDPYDAVALLSHACMLAVGFRLVGLGEDHNIEVSSNNNDTQPLPEEWKASTTSTYAFRYTHSQSSLQYLIKITRLGPKAVINGLAIDDDKVHTLDLIIKDFISPSSFPYPPTPSSSSTTSEEKEKSTPTALRDLFISPGRLTDAASLLRTQIIQKLAPGLRKEGYEDSAHAATTTTTNDPLRTDDRPTRDPPPHPARPNPYNDPLADLHQPRHPYPYPVGDFPPPGFEDEYEINRPPGLGGGIPGRHPLNIGERDLYPAGLGPNDPLRGGVGPGFGGGGGGGGMHPTFDDPMFGRMGGGGGGGQVPPGARYDPVGPGDGPPHLGFPGGGGPRRGGPPNPFGGFGGGDFI